MLLGLLTAALAIQTALEYLALPALFILLGALNGFGWRYYAWTLGGYAAMVILAETIGALLGKRLGRGVAAWLSKVLKSKAPSGSDIEC